MKKVLNFIIIFLIILIIFNRYIIENYNIEEDINNDIEYEFKSLNYGSRETRSSSDDLILQEILGYGSMIGFLNSIKSADIDGDGKDEIVFGNGEGNVVVIEREGEIVRKEWTSPSLGRKSFGLSLGDVDLDSIIEIVVGTSEGFVYVYGWSDSEYELEWKSPDLGNFAYGLDIGNIDNDEYLEIVIGTGDIEFDYDVDGGWSAGTYYSPSEENLFIYGFNGIDYVQEWNTTIPALYDGTGIYNIAIGDTDGDSINEIVFGTFEYELVGGDFQGRYGIYGFDGSTYSFEWTIRELGNWIMGMGIGDTDGDDSIEITIAVWDDAFYVYGYNNLAYIPEWKSMVLSPFALTVGDTNNDKISEIIVTQDETVYIYEKLGVAYSIAWNSNDFATQVTGVGLSQSDNDKNNEVIIAENSGIAIVGKQDETFDIELYDEGLKNLVNIAVFDFDLNGQPELYALSEKGVIYVIEFNINTFRLKNKIELPGDMGYTHIRVADFDNNNKNELLIVMGNTTTEYTGGWLSRSSRYNSSLTLLEFNGNKYSIKSQIYFSYNSIFSVEIGDFDNDSQLEIGLGCANGNLTIVGYDGISFKIEGQISIYDQWVDCIGIGDTDGDGIIEIAAGTDDSMLHIIGYNGLNYIEEWNTTLTQIWHPLALEIGSIDNDKYDEIFVGGVFYDPLIVYGWNGITYIEEDHLGNYEMIFDEGLLIDNTPLGNNLELIICTVDSYVFGYNNDYSEIWRSDPLGAIANDVTVNDIDPYVGDELIIVQEGMVIIYSTILFPSPVLTTSTNLTFIGAEITFDGSKCTGSGQLEYFFDFGDGSNSGWITYCSLTHSYSNSGNYIASLKVKDEYGIESANEARITITIIKPNQAPNAYIDTIEPNPAIEGENISFLGHGSDVDGTIISYIWDSNKDGSISNKSSFITSSLSLGKHSISFKVQDNNGSWSEPSSIILTINQKPENKIPIAIIDSITPNPGIEGEIIYFIGSGEDRDGTITSYVWESNIDGVLSSEFSFQISSLSVGKHIISFRVKDDEESWSESEVEELEIKSKVTNRAPIAVIDSITPNPVTEDITIYFNGYGIDDDGTIISYVWESDIDGILSLEKSFSKSSLSVGVHSISFKVQNDENLWSEPITMTLTVNEIEISTEDNNEAKDEIYNEDLFTRVIIFLFIIIIIIAIVLIILKKRQRTQ